MFGLIAPCRHQLDDELLDQWRSHLCGLCLSLRDRHGQLSRATTNTDAVMTSVLLQAQRRTAARTVTAGPCPLRGMRTAVVIAPSELSVRLAATSSLTLAAAKAGDVVGEQRSGLAEPRRLTTVAAAALAGGLRRKALADHAMSTAIDSAGMLTGLAEQTRIEVQVQRGDSLHEVTELSAAAAGSIFAATASLAGTPGNATELRRMGEAYGRMAHILDAVEDLDDDARFGAFNPLTATGHSVAEAKALCLSLARTIRNGLEELALTDARLLRLLLVDVVHSALHRIFDPALPESSYPPPGPGYPPPGPGYRPPGPGYPPPGYGRRSFWRNVVPWVGVYCTGFALCAAHDNPCTGRRHNAGCGNCDCGDCDCDCCSCCDCSSTSHSGDAGSSQHHACSVHDSAPRRHPED